VSCAKAWLVRSPRSGSLDADEFGACHPQLVVCSITNYGRTGPYYN